MPGAWHRPVAAACPLMPVFPAAFPSHSPSECNIAAPIWRGIAFVSVAWPALLCWLPDSLRKPPTSLGPHRWQHFCSDPSSSSSETEHLNTDKDPESDA